VAATVKNNCKPGLLPAILLLLLAQACFGQKERLQLTMEFGNCHTWKLNMYERNLNLNFKEMGKYIDQCSDHTIISTELRVRITFTRDSLPCCNAVIAADSVMTSPLQMIEMKDCLLSFPKLKQGILYRIGETHKCAEFILTYNHILGTIKVSSHNLQDGKPKK
jgi:hypothetical protein